MTRETKQKKNQQKFIVQTHRVGLVVYHNNKKNKIIKNNSLPHKQGCPSST